MDEKNSASPIAAQAEVSLPPPAGSNLASHMRLWLVALGGLAADLWSKNWAVSGLTMNEARPLIPKVLSMRLSLNPGALFGLGAGMAPIFVGASVLALLFVVYLFWQSTSRHRTLHLALGCVLGGAAGNLYDRTFVTAYSAADSTGRRVVFLRQAGQQDLVIDGCAARPIAANATFRPRDAEYQPVVRDFLSIDLTVMNHVIWPWVFNIADALLVVGVAALLLNFWFDRRPHTHSPPTEPLAAPTPPPQ